MKDHEELRWIINSGYTWESAYVIRTVGDNFIPSGGQQAERVRHYQYTLRFRHNGFAKGYGYEREQFEEDFPQYIPSDGEVLSVTT